MLIRNDKGELEEVEYSWITHYSTRCDIEPEACMECKYWSEGICLYPKERSGDFLIFDKYGRKIVECLYQEKKD